ncbi:ATP-binding protein [Streptomyces xanthophaeus]|uniref:ATP-binding protein n=1 Tax=Streptomyces xanthophaeus TaxID=67385 RepID=UPI0036D0135D
MFSNVPGCPLADRGDLKGKAVAAFHALADSDADESMAEALEHRPESAADARRAVEQALGIWKIGEDCFNSVMIVVSELVTNAIEHALPPLELRLYLYREQPCNQIWVGVVDGGPASCNGSWSTSCAEEECGRGMVIVDALAEMHGVRIQPEGSTTHWALLNV